MDDSKYAKDWPHEWIKKFVQDLPDKRRQKDAASGCGEAGWC